MEAPQNGIDFFLGVVRVEGERVYDEVEDDNQLVVRSRDLLEGAIRVEKVLQHLTDIFRFFFCLIGGTLALKLSACKGLDCFLIKIVNAIHLVDHAYFSKER